MIPFPGPKCFSREGDKETDPFKTEMETMARAGACVCVCNCWDSYVCFSPSN